MSGRTRLLDLGPDLPMITEKEREVLLLVHPYADAWSHKEAADILSITRSSLEGRLRTVFKKIPWLQADMKRKRTEEADKRRSIRQPVRFGDMSGLGSDGEHDTFCNEKIIGKF